MLRHFYNELLDAIWNQVILRIHEDEADNFRMALFTQMITIRNHIQFLVNLNEGKRKRL